MTDDRAIYELLSPPEIAILLAMDPSFVLPNFVEGGKQRMRAARDIQRRRQYAVPGIQHEHLPSVWGMRREIQAQENVKKLEAA